MIQTTKPDTIGASLIDSPVGLAAYVLEKYSTWVNPEYRHLPDGGLTKSLTLDELLTNIMVRHRTISVNLFRLTAFKIQNSNSFSLSFSLVGLLGHREWRLLNAILQGVRQPRVRWSIRYQQGAGKPEGACWFHSRRTRDRSGQNETVWKVQRR